MEEKEEEEQEETVKEKRKRTSTIRYLDEAPPRPAEKRDRDDENDEGGSVTASTSPRPAPTAAQHPTAKRGLKLNTFLRSITGVTVIIPQDHSRRTNRAKSKGHDRKCVPLTLRPSPVAARERWSNAPIWSPFPESNAGRRADLKFPGANDMTEITEDEFVPFMKLSTDPLISQHKVCSQLLLEKRDDLSSPETIYFLQLEVYMNNATISEAGLPVDVSSWIFQEILL